LVENQGHAIRAAVRPQQRKLPGGWIQPKLRWRDTIALAKF